MPDPVRALRQYEDLRRDRTATVQLAARRNETVFHLPDSAEQRERDRNLAAASGERTVHRNAWVFGYDVDEVMSSVPAPHDTVAVNSDPAKR